YPSHLRNGNTGNKAVVKVLSTLYERDGVYELAIKMWSETITSPV
ncbi:6375_t:CDS:1, partial [Dentiscutata erythropus]